MNATGRLAVSGLPGVLLRQLLKGQTVQSILEILLINTKTGNAKKTGQPYSISEAHCVLRNDDGTPGAVGVLTVPKALEGVAKPGKFAAVFTLEAPTYGENAGKIVAALSGLTPIPDNALRSPRAAAA